MLSGLYIKIAAVAVVVAFVLGGVWYVQNLKGEIEVLKVSNTTLKNNNSQLTSEVANQNAAIEAFKIDAGVRLAKATKDLAAAKAATAIAKGKATIIYRATPSVPGTTCEADRQSALDLINGEQK